MATLKTAAIDEARTDYDPSDDTLRGLLIEEQRTNLIINNRDLSAWTINGATGTKDRTGIDGVTNSAWTVKGNTGNTNPRIQRNISVADDTSSYRLSAYFEKNTSTRATLDGVFVDGTTAVVEEIEIDTTDGSIVQSSSGVDPLVEDVGSWWRVSLTATNNGTGNTRLAYRIWPSNTDDEQELGYDYGQVELNASFASSPIETGASAVTRSADTATSTISGTMPSAYSYDITATAGADQDAVLWQTDDGTEDERVRLERISGSLHLIVTAGGTEQANLNLGALMDYTEFTVRCRIAANDVAASLDGGTVQTDTSVTMPSGLTTRRLGQDTTGNHWNAWIKDADEIPRGLSNAELTA